MNITWFVLDGDDGEDSNDGLVSDIQLDVKEHRKPNH